MLRNYQAKARNDIWEAWDNGEDIVMYQCPTGGGKTVLFVQIIKDIIERNKRTMLVAHRRELIYQAARTLKVHQIEPGIIMASVQMDLGRVVQVCSVQTICRRELPPADYYVFDEGHHAQDDNTWGKEIKKAVAAGGKILLVTATPYRLSGEGFEYLHQYKRTHLILGPSMRWLQDEGWLVPLRYFAASIPDLSNIKLKAGEYAEEEAEEAMRLAPIVDSYKEHANGLGGVCFCVNVAHSKTVAAQYNAAGISASHLDAETPEEERDLILEWFKTGHIKVICNVGIITEGFDFPNMDFVQLAQPTKSLSKYLQMVGRVTRPGVQVDKWEGAERRKYEIAKSRKPHGIVLDNAGCWLDHGLPETEHDWAYYFKGAKKAKKANEEMMEVWVFVAEDEDGRMVRTTNPNEIEGLRLVEMTREERRKYVNLQCLKDFDRTFYSFSRIAHMKKYGFLAVQDFIKQCEKNAVLIVPEVWEHIHQRTFTDVEKKIEELALKRIKQLHMYPDNIYHRAIMDIERGKVSRTWVMEQRAAYEKKNRRQLDEAMKGKSVS